MFIFDIILATLTFIGFCSQLYHFLMFVFKPHSFHGSIYALGLMLITWRTRVLFLLINIPYFWILNYFGLEYTIAVALLCAVLQILLNLFYKPLLKRAQ